MRSVIESDVQIGNVLLWLSLVDRINLHLLYSVHSIRRKSCESMLDSFGFCGIRAVTDLTGFDVVSEAGSVRNGSLICLLGRCITGVLSQQWGQEKPCLFLAWIYSLVKTIIPLNTVESILQYLMTCGIQHTNILQQWNTTFLPSLILSRLGCALSDRSEEALQQTVVTQAISHALTVSVTDISLIETELDLLCDTILSFKSLRFQAGWLEELLILQSRLKQWHESGMFLCVIQLLVEICDDFIIT